jgi:hypothetical protein
VNVEYTLPFRRGPRVRTFLVEPARTQSLRPPHPARILALAHRLDDLLRSGVVKDYAATAHLGHLSVSRVSQIMLLLYLAPAIQERVLFMDGTEARVITEEALRKIAREARWHRQTALFERLLIDVNRLHAW